MPGTPLDSSGAFARAVSRLFGWIYTLSWSASFYPQPILNWKRRSTQGTAIDFPAINVLGFACYTLSTAVFLYSPAVRAQYAQRHPRSPEPTVRVNDLAFGGHAFLITALTFSQYYPFLWGFKVLRSQKVSRPIAGIMCGSVVAVSVIVLIVVSRSSLQEQDGLGWAWIDVIYAIGYVKLVVTLVKYMPQVWLNYQRQSTVGWSIWQILFDLVGGILSLFQLLIDAHGDLGSVAGNPVKFGLSNVSIFFDTIFITQHYVLYRHVRAVETPVKDDDRAVEPLLGQGCD